MRKLTSADFNDLPEDMSFDDVEVVLSNRYKFIMRPLSVAMVNATGDGDESAINAIRYSIKECPTPLELDIEFEDMSFAGRQYRVATADSIGRLSPRMLEALMSAIQRVSYLSQGSAEKTDFSPAGHGTETQPPTVSE